MTGRHTAAPRPLPRWRGLLLIALVVAAMAMLGAPFIARADVMPPGPIQPPIVARVTPGAGCAHFGSTVGVSNPVMVIGPAVNVRAGKHPCFDRLVVDIQGPPAGWSAKYKDAFIQDASGMNLPFKGVKVIELVVRTNGHDITTGMPTLSSAGMPNVSGFDTFRDVIFGADFEGQVQLGIGVAAVRPFRVFALAGTGGVSHVVLDVAHHG